MIAGKIREPSEDFKYQNLLFRAKKNAKNWEIKSIKVYFIALRYAREICTHNKIF